MYFPVEQCFIIIIKFVQNISSIIIIGHIHLQQKKLKRKKLY